MTNAEVKESGNGNEEITDAEKTDAKKTEEVNDDAKKAELPPSSSSLSVSSDAEINSLLDIKIQSEVPHIQPPPVLTVPILVISEPSVLTPIPKTPLVAPTITLLPPPSFSTIPPVLLKTTTPVPTPPIPTKAPTITTVIPESDALTVVQLRVSKFEKDVSELKKIDHSTKDLASLKSQVPTGFAAALAVLITRASQSRQHGKSEPGLKSVRYVISNGFDMAYQDFLGVRITFDIFQNIHILYLQYGVLVFSGYGLLIMFPSWSLVSTGIDTSYLP
ncbi:hypothetical protein Tco_0835762 [Tanacetum coccineum]